MIVSFKRIAAAALILLILTTSIPTVSGTADVFAASKPVKVKVTTAKLINRKLVLKWNKAKNAKKYQVFIKKGSAKWKRVATIKKRTYSKAKLAWNTRYSAKVRAINGKKKGKFSTVYKGKTVKKTTLAKEVRKNSTLKSEIKKIEKSQSNDTFALKITFNANTMVFTYTMKEQYTDEQVAALKESFSKSFNTASIKKQMKSTIKQMEDDSGIYGIKIKVVFKNKDGGLIFTKLYK